MFPSTQDYKIALMIGADSFRTLQDVEVVMNPNYPTEPWFSTGGLAIVFKIVVAGKPHALKCFYKDAPERQERLGHIAAYLKNNPSDYFVNFEYLTDELWVEANGHGQGYDVVLMAWVAGETLDNYLEKTCRLNQTTTLQTLYFRFCSLAWWLHQEPFAHGDLKHDNIIVTPDGNLKLIDYDGMYVPALSGRRATEQGSPCYQHPQRNAQHFDAQLDDFSLLVLQITLLALWKKPELFAEHYNGDGILLKDTDYPNFDNATVKQTLWRIPEIKLPLLLGQISVALAHQTPNIDLLVLLQDRAWINWLVNKTAATTPNNLAIEQKKLKASILRNRKISELFTNTISRRYLLTSFLIEKYKSSWNWRGGVSWNETLLWSNEFIEKYKGTWDWIGLSCNKSMPWSIESIENYKDNWDWKWLSKNDSLSWCNELIVRYKDKWDWRGLSMNESLPWSVELIVRYKDKWDWRGLSMNESLPWSVELIVKYKDNWNWYGLSTNNSLPWSIELIEKFEHKWNWYELSRNESLPWSIELIEKYKGKWVWPSSSSDSYIGYENDNLGGLSGNESLPWSIELIEKYKDKWDWWWVSGNKSLPWSIELIVKYKDKWDWEKLSMNDSLPWSIELIEKYNRLLAKLNSGCICVDKS